MRTSFSKFRHYQWWLGMIMVFALTCLSYQITEIKSVAKYAGGALSVAIIIGIVVGNTFFKHIAAHSGMGVDYSQGKLLKYGIILYGFEVTFQEIANIGWQAALIDVVILIFAFYLCYYLYHKMFKIDKKTTILLAVASSICGSAAAIASRPLIRAQAFKVTIAIAVVVVFGTISIFLYPLIAKLFSMSAQQYGVFSGSSVYGVSQAIASAEAYSVESVATAVVVKMFKIMLLIPMLIILSVSFRKKSGNTKGVAVFVSSIPWFAILFLVCSGINSLGVIDEASLKIINKVSNFFLAMSMAASGLRTHITEIKKAGLKPLLLSVIVYALVVVLSVGLCLMLI